MQPPAIAPCCTCTASPAGASSTTTCAASSGPGTPPTTSPETWCPSLDLVARIDYIDDPDAPPANSVVPSVVAAVEDDSGRLLLIHKVDNDLWALPGGGHDVGESISDTVVREVKEETGYDVEVTGIVGTYTNPRHVMAYDDGEVRQQFSIAFTARLIGGEARTSSESKEVRWVEPADLAPLPMHPSMRQRVEHHLQRRREPFIG